MNIGTSVNQRGFSLMEMLVTITILMILAAVAIPNYRNHVLRTQRSEAMAGLMRIAAAQEKFYLQNNRYTTALDESGLNLDTATTNNHYTLSVLTATQNGFNAIAVPAGTQADDEVCRLFSIDERGRKLAQDVDGTATTDTCWR